MFRKGESQIMIVLDGQNRQSPIASDLGSRAQIAGLFAILLYRTVSNESPIARFESQFLFARTRCIVKGESQKSPLFWQFSGSF